MSAARLVKLMGLVLLAVILINSWNSVKKNYAKLVNLPLRLLTAQQLRQLDKLVRYRLLEAESSGRAQSIMLKELCRQEYESSTSEAWRDYWKSGYGLYCNCSLYQAGSTVSMRAADAANYLIASAGPDRKFFTGDDLLSRPATEEMAKFYQQAIDEETERRPRR